MRLPDGTILVSLYNGTVDIMWGKFVPQGEDRPFGPAWDDVYDLYKSKQYGELHPKCDHEKVVVEVATDYGGGFWWKGIGCVECGTFHGPSDPGVARIHLSDHHQDGFGIPSPAEQGIPPPPALAAFDGEHSGLPDWWPGRQDD